MPSAASEQPELQTKEEQTTMVLQVHDDDLYCRPVNGK